jgi:hypothetical protein
VSVKDPSASIRSIAWDSDQKNDRSARGTSLRPPSEWQRERSRSREATISLTRIHDATAAPKSASDDRQLGWSNALFAAKLQQFDSPSTNASTNEAREKELQRSDARSAHRDCKSGSSKAFAKKRFW